MFDAKKVTEQIERFIKDYYNQYHLKGAVLGISGGKDSAVVAGLFCRAIGSENVIGVTLPCHSKKQDKTDAQVVSEHFGFQLLHLDLTDTFDTFTKEFDKGFRSLGITNEMLDNSNINLKPRLRMASVYYIAQALSSLKGQGYLVAGTSNKSELFVGYFTKGGDNVHDISVLGDLTVSEVLQVGDYIGVPKDILYKTPSDGISNQSDEDKLGVKYSDIEKVLKGELLEKEIEEKIEALHNRNQHKFSIPTFKQEDN